MKILSHTLDYLEKKFPEVKINKRLKITQFWCPFCKKNSCQVIPNSGYKLICHACGNGHSMGTIIDVMKKLYNMSEDETVNDMKKVLNIEIVTEKEEIDLLDFYVSQEFDLVPIACNQKIPVEKDWPNKEHKKKAEWLEWLSQSLNIGVKTGKRSNITVVDIDKLPIPEPVASLLKDVKTLTQTTNKGVHYFFKYEEELPKSRIDRLSIDIENDGGQVVLTPSKVENKLREVIVAPIMVMPKELKAFLLTETKNSKIIMLGNTEEKLMQDIQNEDFNIDIIKEGNRNNVFMHLGGILRKELSTSQTKNVLTLLNKHFCNPTLNQKEFDNIIFQLDKYTNYDDKIVANKILQHLRIVEEANARDIRDSLGFAKKKVEDTLSFLLKEQYIIKKRGMFHIIKKVEWKDTFMNEGKEVDFKMPYFHDHAIFRDGDMIVIGAKQKVGKCFGKDTQILMSDGTIKNVQDIKEHEFVMGPDSKQREVLKIIRGKEKLYKITYNFGKNSYVVCENHLLSLKSSGKEDIITISVKDFLTKNKTFQLRSKLYTSQINFPERKLKLDPYFLGLWLGDGSSDSVGITSMDKEVIDYIYSYAKILNLQVSIYNKQKNKAKTYAITTGKVGGNHEVYTLRNLLQDMTLLNNKHVPEIYKTSSKEQRLQLLAGLIDTDGSKVRNRTVSFCNKNKQIIDSTIYIARSLGFRTTTREKYVKGEKYYIIRISGDIHLIPTKINRKQSKQCASTKNPTYYGFTIRSLDVDVGDYYGFEVDKDNLFLTADFVVQHNSHIALNIIKRLVAQGKKPYYINLESGNRFATISKSLGLVEGDFWNATHFSPEQVEIEKNAITIIDWLLPDDYAGTDKLYQYFAQQLVKNGGILIIFVQLKDNGDFFAKNMIAMFPAFVCRYFYTNEDRGTEGAFSLDYMREGRYNTKKASIPCVYDWSTKELKRVDEMKDYNLNGNYNDEIPDVI